MAVKTYLVDLNKDLTSVSGDLALIKNERAIVEKLKNLLMTESGDIAGTDFGTSLRRFLLKKATAYDAFNIMNEVNDAINLFIPEITKHVVNVYLKNDTYDIEIIVDAMSIGSNVKFVKSLKELR